MKDNALRIDQAFVNFDAVEVFRDLSIEIKRGEFVALVGPSGCGKTTLLNLLSGFLKPTSGRVLCQGSVRMVHQHDSLFPWQTVAQNIALGLRELRSETERVSQLNKMLRLINRDDFAQHYPHQLSGGMRQRVELAGALGGDPDILLLHEPFSSCDYLTRLRMRGDLARMLEELPRTVVLLTPDIEEAPQLGDRTLVLSDRPARILRELRMSVPRPRE